MTGTGSLQGGGGPLGAEAEERALSYAKDVLRQGMPRAAVEEVLRAQGFDPAAASGPVRTCPRARCSSCPSSPRTSATGEVAALKLDQEIICR